MVPLEPLGCGLATSSSISVRRRLVGILTVGSRRAPSLILDPSVSPATGSNCMVRRTGVVGRRDCRGPTGSGIGRGVRDAESGSSILQEFYNRSPNGVCSCPDGSTVYRIRDHVSSPKISSIRYFLRCLMIATLICSTVNPLT